MSSAVRSTLSTTGRRLLQGTAASSCQQQRFAGNLPVKSNQHIEAWGTLRENLEQHFKFDGTAYLRIALWAVGFPLFIYKVSIAEFDKADTRYGREKRDMM